MRAKQVCSFALALLFSTFLLSAQNPKRFESGPYKGFIRSRTENVLDEIHELLRVRSIHGVIRSPNGEPLPEVIIEIRSAAGTVNGVETDGRGEFKMSHVPNGTYAFKFTKDGFQSIVGTIEVGGSAPRNSRISLAMKLGV